MSTISASDLKAGGVTAIEQAMNDDEPVIISVRGKARYAVIDINLYHTLREMELDKAISETESDLNSGDFETVVDLKAYLEKLAKEAGFNA